MKNKWHCWGRWEDTLFFTSFDLATKESKVFKKLALQNIINGDAKAIDGYYYSLKSDINNICEFLDKNKNWLNKFFSICNEETNKLLKLENKINFEDFINQMLECISCSKLINFLDLYISKKIEELCKNTCISYSTAISWIKPSRKTQLMMYQYRLRKLKHKNIDKFLKEFEWVGTRLLNGKPLTRKKILYELRSLNANKKEVYKILKEFKHIISNASELTFQRTNLAEVVIRVSYSYWSLLNNLAKKHSLDFSDIGLFTYYELLDLYYNEKIPSNLKQRKRFGLSFINGKWDILLNKELEKELILYEAKNKVIKEIKGIVAYSGKVIGKVRIIQNQKDAEKLIKGEIVVAPETTTDYITALRKSIAFITNQGGITSHAAILARELKKPCIIATKIATKVLKNGMLIEVDANKGIVKVIKK